MANATPTATGGEGLEKLRQEASTCDFVRFSVADVHGIARGRSVPRKHVGRFIQDGIGVYAGLVIFGPRCEITQLDCLKETGYGNGMARAIPGTFNKVSWAGGDNHTVGEVMCETFWPDGTIQDACPRYVARKQLQRLETLEQRMSSGWELEFYIFDKLTQKPMTDGVDLQSLLVLSENEDFYYSMLSTLQDSGIEVEGVHNEYGPGQFEIITPPMDGIGAADTVFRLKQAVKEIAWGKGWQITFMTMPYMEHSPLKDYFSSGLHFNFSLWQNSENPFHGPGQERELSATARHWIAGLIKHAPALAALCCPTVNCYRRLRIGFAPKHANWGFEHRESFIRVKHGSKGPYLENRLPSSASNPYLVVAASTAAGLDGVEKKMECPIEMDPAAPLFPNTLGEALDALEQDATLCEALGAQFVEWFLFEKRQIELQELKEFDPKVRDPETMKKENYLYLKLL